LPCDWFGDGAGVWLRMQAAYDAWQAERAVDVSNVKLIRAVYPHNVQRTSRVSKPNTLLTM
jgi:plasmid maintenance system antidote protein VapI